MAVNEEYRKLGEIARWVPIRNHVFNIIEHSENSARNLAKSYVDKGMLTSFQYLGLVTEIDYYICKKEEHKLTLSGDTELTDFTGEINGDHCRIQVSNNMEIKLKDRRKFEAITTPLPYYIVSPKNNSESACEYDEIKITKQGSTNSFSTVEILVGIEGKSERGNNEFFTELHHLSYDLNSQRATLIDSHEGLGFPSSLILRDRNQEDLYDLGTNYLEEVCPGMERAKMILKWYDSTREYFTPLVYAEIGHMQNPEHHKSTIIALEIVYSMFDLGDITELPFDEENRDERVNLAFRYN